MGHSSHMETHHVVTFSDGVTLTRLPVGRAAGRLWLSFVATVIHHVDPADVDPEDLDDWEPGEWEIEAHFELNGLRPERGGGHSGGGLEHMHFDYEDPGADTATISYLDAHAVIDCEEIVLPKL